MWECAIRVSTQRVTDALLHRPVLPSDAKAFEKVSGVIAVRTAVRLPSGDQSLIFAVPQVTASTARHVAAALLVGDHAHANGREQVPEPEVRHLLKGDILIVTQAIAESKARFDELPIGRNQRLSDIWEITPLTRYTVQKSSKPRVFLANPGWVTKLASGRRFGAVVIDASHPRTFDQLPQLFRVAQGCSALRIAIAPPPSEAVLTACGAPTKSVVWLWDPSARIDAETVVERQDGVRHVVGQRYLWVCDSDVEATAALSGLHKRLTDSARAAEGRHYPGLRECWGIYNRLRQVMVPLAELEQAEADTWAGNLRGRLKELDAVSGHGTVAWDTTWPALHHATKAAYETLLKRRESAKFWALSENLQEFLTSDSPHLRIVVGSQAEVTLLVHALELLVDGFADALAAGRIEFVTSGKEARLVAEGQSCQTVLLAPRASRHRYLDLFPSHRVDEYLYPHEVEPEKAVQARLHGLWETMRTDEERTKVIQSLGFRPLANAQPRATRGGPSLLVRRAGGHAVDLIVDASVSEDIDIDALAAVGGGLFETGAIPAQNKTGGSGDVTEVGFVRGETRNYYGQQRVDVFFPDAGSLQRWPARELRPGWQVVTFVDGRYDSLFHRLAEVVNARLPPEQRVALELWKASKEQLAERVGSKRALFDVLMAKGLASEYAAFSSWFGDSDDAVLAPQQFADFKVLASEIPVYAKSRPMLEAAFKAIQNERGRNRVTGKTLRRFLRAVISGEGYDDAMESAQKLDAALADVFAAVEVLEVISVRQVQRNSDANDK